MTRQEIIDDIQRTVGSSPDFLTSFPDQMLEHVWGYLKGFQLAETTIPNKYKELIGLGVAAQMQCQYCIYFHTEAAKFWGATQTEIWEALTMAMGTAGLSTYIAGTGYDVARFRQETDRILEYVRQQARTKAA